jgi:hypothetical protein
MLSAHSTNAKFAIWFVRAVPVIPIVDRYASSYSYQQVVFEQSGLAAGSHTLRVTNTGTKNSSASGFYADLDAVEAEALTP